MYQTLVAQATAGHNKSPTIHGLLGFCYFAVASRAGTQIRTSILPVLAPSSRSMKACGAFSSPATMVSS